MTAETAPLATVLASWAAGLRHEQLPAEVVADARLRLLDTLGIMLAARDTPIGRAVRDAVAALGRGDAARIVGTDGFNTASLAALANGTLAHALDFDDTHGPSVMHPSAVSVPTALAVAQGAGCSGADLVIGIALGNEIGCRLGLVAPGAFHAVGLHPTSVLGAPAAAIVAGRMMKLSANRIAWAVGIAASQASGTLEAYSDGSWSKTLHPGWAAHAGIVAATLANCGFTGPASGLDGRYGLFASHLQRGPDRLDYGAATEGLGVRWHMLETSFKLYPNAHAIHAFIEAALILRARHDLTADRITEIMLDIPAGFIGQIAEPRAAKLAPQTPTHARASVLYAVAVALVSGAVGPEDYTEAAIRRPEILALCQRIHHRPTTMSEAPIRFSGGVTISADGATFDCAVEEADGTGTRPLQPARLEDKFRRSALANLGAGRVEAVISMCRVVETLPGVDLLLAATGAA